MAKKGTQKVDPRVESLAAALATEGELERLRAVYDELPDDDVAAIAIATATLARDGTSDRGAASAYLRALAGVASDADVGALAELALTARTNRVVLSKALVLVADRIDGALLARVSANIEPSVPYSEIVVGAGRRAVRAFGDAQLAAILDERASFLERHRALLADATAKAKEKARDAAGAALMKLAGDDDRRHAALWLLTEGSTSRAATAWARNIVIAEPALHPLPAAMALSDISDDELPGVLAAVTEERALAILDEALERDWADTVANLARGRPSLFATPRAFAALLRAFDAKQYYVVTKMFGSITRHWAKPLDDAQAAQIAERMIALLGDSEEYVVKAVANSCHYFMHPGGIPVFRRALEGTLTHAVRDALYDAVHSTKHHSAHDLLIDRLFVETENLRDLVFSYNQAVPAARQGEVLARIAAEKSLDAAWKFVSCQVHWAHHPRNVVAAVEHVLEWPDGDPQKRALIFSWGVRAAIELHQYDLARRCLDALGAAANASDPTESKEVATVLGQPALAKQLEALRSRELDVADQKLADTVAAARAAGKPLALDDAQLGALAKTKVGWVLHRDATTHEVWWFDLEHEFFYYDGSALAPVPFEIATLQPAEGYDVFLPALGTFCAGWTTEERLLQRGVGNFRHALRCGARLVLRFAGSVAGTWQWPFTLVFPDTAAATRAVAALAENPPPDHRTVDPFYVTGKKGGALVYEYGNSTEWGFVAGKDMYWGPDRWGSPRPHPSHADAVAAFSRGEDSAIQRGLIPRKIELEERIRALDDLPLAKWLQDRARDDDRPASWHIEAFGAVDAALAITGLTIRKELQIGPPATAEELASYDATLPEPMPDEMRAMWSTASTVSWRIGDRSMRLLSPAEVIANRKRHRDAIAASLKKNRDAWPLEHLDVFVLDGEAPALAFDVRQEESDTWTTVEPGGSPFTMGLGHILGSQFTGEYVAALVKLHTQLKKLNYGQSFAELGASKSTKTSSKKTSSKAKVAAKTSKAKVKSKR